MNFTPWLRGVTSCLSVSSLPGESEDGLVILRAQRSRDRPAPRGLLPSRARRMSRAKRKDELPVSNGGVKVKQSPWSKALRGDAAWEDKDEFLDVIYWMRQILAIVLGVIWGIAPLKGFVGIAIFCLINAGVLYLYFSSFQQIDEEEYGGTWELTKEGFMTSFALFLYMPAQGNLALRRRALWRTENELQSNIAASSENMQHLKRAKNSLGELSDDFQKSQWKKQ
ncbi:unnamed protein product, partial [Ranitomeya imitator]